jgi:hypothetical protein
MWWGSDWVLIICFILLDTNYPASYNLFSELLNATLTRMGEPEMDEWYLTSQPILSTL